jgi:vacuolar-type H+-ATPase subunit C/Vma6
MSTWDDLNARARGLATHLLAEATLSELARTPDLRGLARRLAEAGVNRQDAVAPGPAALGREVRRWAARQLNVVCRWLGPRTPLLRCFLEEEDRQSLRAMVRGAAAGVPAEQRLEGLIPTPGLPSRLLEELAAQPGVRDIAARLTLWRHPYAAAVALGVGTGEPDLFRIEAALNRTFAARVTRGARDGSTALRRHVAEQIDRDNVLTALLLVGTRPEWPLETAFSPGGRDLTLPGFVAAARATDLHGASILLAQVIQDRTLADLVRRHGATPVRLESALRVAQREALRARARLDPLSEAPLLAYLYRLREQTERITLAIWAAAMGAPPGTAERVLGGVT